MNKDEYWLNKIAKLLTIEDKEKLNELCKASKNQCEDSPIILPLDGEKQNEL
jgi:hypothetical protein